jgi:L-ascorbate metabolism protein UlaG (beta-lactamase superfamily)
MIRFCGLLLTGLLPFGVAAGGGGEPKQVQITWHGQSFFEVRSSKGTNVVIDPHLIPAYGRIIGGIRADVVLMTHQHKDHTMIEALGYKDPSKLKVIKGWQGDGQRATWNIVDEKVKDVRIRSVGTYHDNVQGLQRGKNTVFILEVDGWRIVHLGDLGHLLTPTQLKQIGPVDVLMIPVGGVYTLNGSEAKEVVAQIKPREYILPMHFGTAVFDELLPVTEFLDEQPRSHVAKSKDNRLVLNRDPQRPRPLIVVLNYWPEKKR